jgi:hypothetical protein
LYLDDQWSTAGKILCLRSFHVSFMPYLGDPT